MAPRPGKEIIENNSVVSRRWTRMSDQLFSHFSHVSTSIWLETAGQYSIHEKHSHNSDEIK